MNTQIRFLLLVIVVALVLYGMNLYKDSKEYQKPEAWVISQGLNSTLTKQQLLLKEAKGGQVTLEDLARVATASTDVKAEAVKIGSDYLLSTGADGKVEVVVDPGTYKVELVTIPEIDFTGVPGIININGGENILSIGLVEGSGKVKAGIDLVGQQPPDLRGRLQVSLFQDKNGDGKKDNGEPYLPWAGVTIKLTKVGK